jgi:hypothetical protein
MITTTSTWRCRCGVNIKVVGETERKKPLATSIAQCPKCGDQQVIYSGRILSISIDREEPARPSKD